MNPLSNAIDVTGPGGELIVRTGDEGSVVWIEVADNCFGIDPSIIEQILDPFFTTKPVGWSKDHFGTEHS